jgi:ribonuclease-3
VQINPDMPAAAKDAKTELQELLQGQKLKLPAYNVMSITGAAHRQTFEVQCAIEQMQREARGFGGSRRAAEQEAALAMLKLIKTVV